MNKQELINVPRIVFPVGTEVLIKGKIVGLNVLDDRFVENVVKLAYGEQIIAPNDAIYVKDEPETGHADEAPRYLKNILARLRELPVHDRGVWLKAIMSEFEQEFCLAKWREGYEQGKFEGEWVGNQLKDADKVRCELNKVKVKQFVAEIIEYYKGQNATLYDALREKNFNKQYNEWLMNEQDAYNKVARAWLDGYEVEEDKKFFVKIKCLSEEYKYLNYFKSCREWIFSEKEETKEYRTAHTRKELEEAGFSEVFNSPLFEVLEVE